MVAILIRGFGLVLSTIMLLTFIVLLCVVLGPVVLVILAGAALYKLAFLA